MARFKLSGDLKEMQTEQTELEHGDGLCALHAVAKMSAAYQFSFQNLLCIEI